MPITEDYKTKLNELALKISEEINDTELIYSYLSDVNNLLFPIIEKLDASDFYIWGLIYYSISSEPTENSMAKFIKSIQIDPTQYISRLYLGHTYQDREDWHNAIEEYLKVDQERLGNEYDIWRVAYLNEQIGYCYWKINQKDDAIRFFENVSNIWKSHNDLSIFLQPSRMIDCLGSNHILLDTIDISKMKT